jgi:hypothetical protein
MNKELCSEMSEYIIQTPEIYPEEGIQHVGFYSKNKFEKLVHLLVLL